ncbi:flavodoxin domain-containing protein [Paenibacillus sp. MMS20-IR301]|uniref:flavodoxin domain-containing protein n=1 Tax=Paenibacillus sp. MMS20-IR301 TaxID=2895946 RepID=UPI0028E98175|nr:flavodoxin domain-containing protein [Paenibacillus sp. MMS20-IR301]WNS45041.1 flavodoxin domain-containing protein [Paenibacillus sp. MMS20-IR301]
MGRTLIVYTSKYGCTEKAALLLKARLDGAEAVNLKSAKVPALTSYDTVILGGSIYFGKIRKEMVQYTAKHEQELSTKRIGLFICAGMRGEQAEQELKQAYPESLNKIAVTRVNLGDEIYPEKLSFMDKWVVRMVRGKGMGAAGGLSMDQLDRFARAMTGSG